MNIFDIISVDRIKTNVLVKSKKRAFEYVSALITSAYNEFPERMFFEALWLREKLGSTGVGKGIAIPHARVEKIEQITGALITLSEPIDYDSIDNQPVDVIFAIAIPDKTAAAEEHLHLLSMLADFFRDSMLRNKVRELKEAKKIRQLFADAKK